MLRSVCEVASNWRNSVTGLSCLARPVYADPLTWELLRALKWADKLRWHYLKLSGRSWVIDGMVSVFATYTGE